MVNRKPVNAILFGISSQTMPSTFQYSGTCNSAVGNTKDSLFPTVFFLVQYC